MTTITTRSGKGSPLTNAEVDANFTNLNDDKVEASGDSMTGNLSFGDNNKAIFGGGNDLQIYHDGSNSYIQDNGTGALILVGTTSTQIRGSSFVILRSTAGENMAVGNANGSFDLYYDNAKKLATTATGIDVTGTVTADGLTVETDTGITLKDGADTRTANLFLDGGAFQQYVTGSADIHFYSTDSKTLRMAITGNTGDISFYEDTGTTPKFFWDASEESLRVPLALYNNSINAFPSTGYAAIYSTGTGGSAPFNEAGHLVLQARSSGALRDIIFATGNGAAERMRIDSAGNVGIGTSSPAQMLELSANNGLSGVANVLRFNDSDVGVTAAQPTGRIEFAENDGGNTTVSAFLEVETVGTSGGGEMTFGTGAAGVTATERMRIDSSGNVGIKDGDLEFQNPLSNFAIKVPDREASQYNIGDRGNITIQASNSTSGSQAMSGGRVLINAGNSHNGQLGHIILSTGTNIINTAQKGEIRFNIGGTASGDEAMRIDSSGNLLVGKTSADVGATAGFEWYDTADVLTLTRSGGNALSVNRLSTDGNLATFRKDGTTVGSIGSRAGVVMSVVLDPRANGVGLTGTTNAIEPTGATGTVTNQLCDLGGTSSQFKDLYLSGGVYLGGTGTANKLDDYETGTWSATINGSATGLVFARYVKVGSTVTISALFNNTASWPSGYNYIGGIPFSNGYGPASLFSADATTEVFNQCGVDGDRIKFRAASGGSLKYLSVGATYEV